MTEPGDTSTDITIAQSHIAALRMAALVNQLQGIVSDFKVEMDRMMADETLKPDLTVGPITGAPVADERLAASADNLATQVVELSAAMSNLRRDQENDKKLLKGFDSLVRKLRWLVRFDIALSVILFIGGVLLALIGHNVQHVSACQARVNDETRAALAQRADAANKMNAAQDALFSTLLDPKSTATERLQASVTYHNMVHTASLQRDANPLPTENCG